MEKIKIIIDTDIGDDIDDVWAVVLALAEPRFDVLMISVSEGGVEYKAKIIASILQACNRTDIPIVIGEEHGFLNFPQKSCVKNIDLKDFSVDRNYKVAYERTLEKNPSCKVIAIGPNTTLQHLTDVFEKNNTTVLAMAGSIYMGYFNRNEINPECNIVSNIAASQKVLSAKNGYVMLPLDVCNDIRILGDDYQKLLNSTSVFAKEILRHYFEWDNVYEGGSVKYGHEQSSTIIYDFVPFWFLLFPQLFKTENLKIFVDDAGFTIIGKGKEILVATKLLDLKYLIDYSIKILT